MSDKDKEPKYGSWASWVFFVLLMANVFGAGIPWWVVWFPVASPLVSAVIASSMYLAKSFWQQDSLMKLKAELLVAQSQLDALTDKWNALVKRVNARGGEEFLSSGGSSSSQFSKAEIAQLIKLCHPDKHGGSEVAGEITRKLLTLRKP